MKNILILGGGFAGLIAAERLSGFFGSSHQTTLVSPQRAFTFYPGLVRLAFGDLDEEDITFDLAEKLDKIDVRFVEGEALRLKPSIKRAQVAGRDFNGELSYDYLIIAMGRRLATEKIPGFFENAHHLLGVRAAKKFGEAVDKFQKGRIVVGLSPEAFLPVPVCETAFALARRFSSEMSQKNVSVAVVFPETIKKAFGGANIHWELEKAFEKHGIEVITNFKVSEVTPDKLVSADGESVFFDLLMLLPPFRGQTMLTENKITDKLGFVEVDKMMRVQKLKDAYAAGDIIALPGPKLAHTAIEQAEVAAVNVMRAVEGRQPDAFYYHEIDSIIDQGGADSIYLNYAVWDKTMYTLKRGRMWGVVKRMHDKLWRVRHKSAVLDQGI